MDTSSRLQAPFIVKSISSCETTHFMTTSVWLCDLLTHSVYTGIYAPCEYVQTYAQLARSFPFFGSDKKNRKTLHYLHNVGIANRVKSNLLISWIVKFFIDLLICSVFPTQHTKRYNIIRSFIKWIIIRFNSRSWLSYTVKWNLRRTLIFYDSFLSL